MSVDELRFRASLEYLYGRGVGDSIPWQKLTYRESGRSRRLKQVMKEGSVYVTVRENGMLALSLECAEHLLREKVFRKSCVMVKKGFEDEIRKGLSLFCKHVKLVGPNVAPGLDVGVVDEDWKLLGVGKALLPREYMLAFKSGVAVRVRVGKGQKGLEKDLS